MFSKLVFTSILIGVAALVLSSAASRQKIKPHVNPADISRPPRPYPLPTVTEYPQVWRGLQSEDDYDYGETTSPTLPEPEPIVLEPAYNAVVGVVFALLGVAIGLLCMCVM